MSPKTANPRIVRWMSPVAVSVLFAGLFGLALAPPAKADAWDQRTIVTLDQPVKVPDGKVLPAGRYVFKLFDSNAERQVVQVFNTKGRIVASFLGVPVYRETPSRHTILTFNESGPNAPRSLHEWFYPGDNYGLRFNYPHPQTSNAD